MFLHCRYPAAPWMVFLQRGDISMQMEDKIAGRLRLEDLECIWEAQRKSGWVGGGGERGTTTRGKGTQVQRDDEYVGGNNSVEVGDGRGFHGISKRYLKERNLLTLAKVLASGVVYIRFDVEVIDDGNVGPEAHSPVIES